MYEEFTKRLEDLLASYPRVAEAVGQDVVPFATVAVIAVLVVLMLTVLMVLALVLLIRRAGRRDIIRTASEGRERLNADDLRAMRRGRIISG